MYLLKLSIICFSRSMLKAAFIKDNEDKCVMPTSESLFSMMIYDIIRCVFENIILLSSCLVYILSLTFQYGCFSINLLTMILFAKYMQKRLLEIGDEYLKFSGGGFNLLRTNTYSNRATSSIVFNTMACSCLENIKVVVVSTTIYSADGEICCVGLNSPLNCTS